MSKSKRYNWPELLTEFEQSDLSQIHVSEQVLVFVTGSYYNVPRPDFPF